jgi:hypothetical protein
MGKMELQKKTNYERFVDAFHKRYKDELMHVGLVPEKEMLWLYCQFKGSDKTPEQWFEQQEWS